MQDATCSFPGAGETICRREPEPMMNPSSIGCAHATSDARSIGNPYVLGTCCRRFTAISGSAGLPAADHRFDDHPSVYAYGQHGESLPSVQSRQQGMHALLAFHRLFHGRNINIFIAFTAYWSLVKRSMARNGVFGIPIRPWSSSDWASGLPCGRVYSDILVLRSAPSAARPHDALQKRCRPCLPSVRPDSGRQTRFRVSLLVRSWKPPAHAFAAGACFP